MIIKSECPSQDNLQYLIRMFYKSPYLFFESMTFSMAFWGQSFCHKKMTGGTIPPVTILCQRSAVEQQQAEHQSEQRHGLSDTDDDEVVRGTFSCRAERVG